MSNNSKFREYVKCFCPNSIKIPKERENKNK